MMGQIGPSTKRKKQHQFLLTERTKTKTSFAERPWALPSIQGEDWDWDCSKDKNHEERTNFMDECETK